MQSNQFDALTQELAVDSRPLAAASRNRRGALAALVGGTLGLVTVTRADAKKRGKKGGKKGGKKNKPTPPPPPADICPTGRTRLSNGTCATICAAPGQFAQGGCQCTVGPNTEGQNLLTPSVGLAQCGSLTQVCTTTAECPVGQMCLNTGCGGANANRCHAVCA